MGNPNPKSFQNLKCHDENAALDASSGGKENKITRVLRAFRKKMCILDDAIDMLTFTFGSVYHTCKVNVDFARINEEKRKSQCEKWQRCNLHGKCPRAQICNYSQHKSGAENRRV